jgi:hypothetical protein
MLFSPLAGKAQNNSTINLADTEWRAGPITIPTLNTDHSVTTLTRKLVFYRQGKVEAAVIRDKTWGFENKLVYDYAYNSAKNRYEYMYVSKLVRTLPEFNAEAWAGTYEVKGKSVYLDFPACTIDANIYSDSIKGVATHKNTGEKEAWILFALASNQNHSNGDISLQSLLEDETTNPLAPSGEIEKMWVDYDVHDKERHGMRIHLKFNVSNLKDMKCSANVYFYYASGKPLKDSNGKFKTTDGNVAVHEDFIPTYVDTVYKDFQLFMPYEELHMATRNYSLKFDAQIYCSAVGFVTTSKDQAFDYSRLK